ncbi:GFA family protein [Oscillatoria sp. FACHB-1406]|uniref:GFA family protein n=1 Tax=Oscillatoria sp. FACHB-1406 TaxID=2692846 RepID=UPI001685E97E|nr:GFA family protein [Oscillatoria sp. FACHB-1406]MBD2578562.1 GFA family protein [Oscillatoria sp. FACHB-1406]
MTRHFTGGCSCGAVRYEGSADPIVMANCHCRDCQKATGGAFASGFLVPRDAVKIEGEVKWYQVTGDSGKPVGRGFCPVCGSRLFSQPPNPELLAVAAGNLDDSSWFSPTMDIYTASAQPWACMNPELSKFAKMPSA